MKKEVNPEIKKEVNKWINHAARYVEIAFSIIILSVIALAGFHLVADVLKTGVGNMDTEFFSEFLSNALSLVVGVEFVKMLCSHSSYTMVEVLMFATARQMVVEHLQTWQTLIGVAAIALLFFVRKYLIAETDNMEQEHNAET